MASKRKGFLKKPIWKLIMAGESVMLLLLRSDNEYRVKLQFAS